MINTRPIGSLIAGPLAAGRLNIGRLIAGPLRALEWLAEQPLGERSDQHDVW